MAKEATPLPGQLRIEYDRRKAPVRQYTPCTTQEHQIMQTALRMTTTAGIMHMLRSMQVRTDVPSHLVDPCSCGGGVPTNKWG